MRKFIIAALALALAAPAFAQAGPKMSKSGGIGSATSVYAGSPSELTGGTYAINGTTGAATLKAGTINVPAAPDLTVGSASPGNVVKVAAGNSVAYCPDASCVPITTGNVVHRATSALFSAVTAYDGQAEEDTVAIHTKINKGYMTPLARSTAYTIGQNAWIGNAVYRATTSGATAAGSPPPGTRPVSFPFTYADGAVTWLWINDYAVNAKTSLYMESIVEPGGGPSWGQATNHEMKIGALPTNHVAGEFDFTNNTGTDCVVGVNTCDGLIIVMGGTDDSITGLTINSKNGILPGSGKANYGIRLNGEMIRDSLAIDTIAERAIGVGTFLPATYSIGTIDDHATAPASYIAAGTNSVAAILLNGVGLNAVSVGGAYTYSFTAPGFTVDALGNTIAASIQLAGNSVAGLGACTAGNKYQIKAVGDLAAPTWNATAVGGGAIAGLALCDGANWKVR